MRLTVLLFAFLGAFLTICVSRIESRKSLKECAPYGCYEEKETRFLANLVEHLDKNYFRDPEFEERSAAELRENMTFNLYNFPTHPQTFEEVKLGGKPEFYDKNLPTKIIIHGWQNNGNSSIGQSIKDAYLKMGRKYNIFVVDWSNKAMRMYNRARACVPLVADLVAEFVDQLVQSKKLDVKKLHIIGHSLGAHVAGLTGTRIKAGRPGRVTGLDPARPTFGATDERISKECGDYVDIIHSCGNRLGLTDLLGHVDYYPNRGEAFQRGCVNDLDGSCSHAKSYEFFAESLLNPKAFKAIHCQDWETFRTGSCANEPTLYIGEDIPKKYREGAYFLKTAKTLPLGLGEDSIVYTEEDIKDDDVDSNIAKLLFSII